MLRPAALIATIDGGGFSCVANAADKVCKLAITGTDLMQYDKKELDVAADCTAVELTLTHGGKLPKEAMGHNWVLVATPGPRAPYSQLRHVREALPTTISRREATRRCWRSTKLVGGGESATALTFSRPSILKKERRVYVLRVLCRATPSVMRGVLGVRLIQMEAEIADLLNLLELEQLEVNLFRGESRDVGSPQVFGGQVLKDRP